MKLSFDSDSVGYFLKPITDGTEKTTLLDRFTIVEPWQPSIVTAQFGPLFAHQIIPTGYPSQNLSYADQNGIYQISAHVVKSKIRKDSPVVRVLFHTSHTPVVKDNRLKNYEKLCISLVIVHEGERHSTACVPAGRDDVCLAEVTLPPHWWQVVDDTQQQDSLQVYYLTQLVGVTQKCPPQIDGNSAVNLGSIKMMYTELEYKEVKEDDGLIVIKVPKQKVYPGTKFYVPVYLEEKARQSSLYVFVIR